MYIILGLYELKNAVMEQLINDVLNLPNAPFCPIGRWITQYTGLELSSNTVRRIVEKSSGDEPPRFRLNMLHPSKITQLPPDEQQQHAAARRVLYSISPHPETLVFDAYRDTRGDNATGANGAYRRSVLEHISMGVATTETVLECCNISSVTVRVLQITILYKRKRPIELKIDCVDAFKRNWGRGPRPSFETTSIDRLGRVRVPGYILKFDML